MLKVIIIIMGNVPKKALEVKMEKEAIVKEVTLNDNGEIVAVKGEFVTKKRIVELDNLCYRQILIDLGIEVLE